jgi:exodeoxyribonuclease V gamma subunit
MTTAGPDLRPDRAPHAGIVLVRAGRLERLLEPFDALLRALAPADPLEAIPVVAGHPGMRQWLEIGLARLRGAGGVVAGLDRMLPSGFVDRLAERLLGERAVGLPAWRHEHLRWTIEDLLRAPDAHGLADPTIRRFLSDDDTDGPRAGLARFELADRLARIYARHLVYRPDWLTAWEQGRQPIATPVATGCLAPLWRALVARLGRHRAAIVDDLVAALAKVSPPWPAVHVFGVSHLAPVEIDVLHAVARHVPVCVYLLDPSRDDWIGLPSGAAAFADFARRAAERIAAGDETTDEIPHPLLARWGRLGQQFLGGLAGRGASFDVRDEADPADERAGSLLARVQQGLRANRIEAPAGIDRAALRHDASLRIHACHTRVRELEVLHDALLDAIAAGIRPEDICVMAPDIGPYAPLLPGVFGAPGLRDDTPLPWHLADVPASDQHRLVVAVRELLALPHRRIDVPAVLDWLAIPEVRRRHGLSEADVQAIEDWLARARVGWGLDGADRARERLPPEDTWTFGWAIERLLAGYLAVPPEPGPLPAAITPGSGSAIAPLGGVQGPGAAALGALDAVLAELARWRALGDRPRRASAWARELACRLDALFAIDPLDPPARAALAAVRDAVAALEGETVAAGVDPELGFETVRRVIEERLDAPSERQPLLAGGVTFCHMVPQRAIPFAMIAVLGLDEGTLPRTRIEAGLDPIASHPRFGDRDPRDDDRYLFLETLMAARDRLHLSWRGLDERDGSARSSAAVLAELMATLDAMHGLAGGDVDRPWLVRHALQPFDARYFRSDDSADPRLRSHSAAFAAMRADASPPAPALVFAGGPATTAPAPSGDRSSETVPLAALVRWYRDPLRELVEGRLGLAFDALADTSAGTEEPLEAALSPLERWPERLLFELVVPAGTIEALDAEARARLRHAGVLPPGAAGDAAWSALVEVVAAGHAAWQALPLAPGARPLPSSIEVDIGDARLAGRVEGVAPTRDGLALVRLHPEAGGAAIRPESRLHFGQRVPLFLEWALLRLMHAEGPAASQRVHAIALGSAPADPSWLATLARFDEAFASAKPRRRAALARALAARVGRLVALWRAAPEQPAAYFPRAAAEIARGRSAVPKLFGDWGGTGELDYAPPRARLLGLDAGLDDENSPAYRRLAETCHAIAEAITPALPGEETR